MKKLFAFLLIAIMVLASCSNIANNNTEDPVVTPVATVSPSLSLDKSIASIDITETLTITATATGNVLWLSSDTSVATVSVGIVTPKKAGTTTITAKMGDLSKTCTISINDKEIKPQVSDYTKKYYAIDGTTLTAMLSVSGTKDSFTGDISNSVTYATYATINNKKTLIGITFIKLISSSKVTYTISAVTTGSSYVFLSALSPLQIKLTDTTIYTPSFLTTSSDKTSSGLYEAFYICQSSRDLLNKLRSEKTNHEVRFTTLSYGSIDFIVPNDFFINLSAI